MDTCPGWMPPSRTPFTRTRVRAHTASQAGTGVADVLPLPPLHSHYLEWKQLQPPRFQPTETKSGSTLMEMHMLAFKVPQVSKILIHILAIRFGSVFVFIYLVCGVQSVLLAVSGQFFPWRSNQVIKLGDKWQMCLSALSPAL